MTCRAIIGGDVGFGSVHQPNVDVLCAIASMIDG